MALPNSGNRLLLCLLTDDSMRSDLTVKSCLWLLLNIESSICYNQVGEHGLKLHLNRSYFRVHAVTLSNRGVQLLVPPLQPHQTRGDCRAK